jgi:hypothetical protein
VALGTILVFFKADSELKNAAKEIFDVPGTLGKLRQGKYLDEPRFKTVAGEIGRALK